MLYLTPGVSHSIVVTLQERSVNQVNPYYLWDIVSGDTNIHYQFTADDISSYPWYYNQFAFTVIPGATYGATQGIIPAYGGQYYYTIYENNTRYGLNIYNTVGIVETGILNIFSTYSSHKSYTASNNRTVKTYQKIIKNS